MEHDFKYNSYSSTEEYLLHRIAELENEVEMYKEYITKIEDKINWQPIINPITNKEKDNNTTISDIEKELREKIAAECAKKGTYWYPDMCTAQSNRYDFKGCPDDYYCLKDYTFSAICDEVYNMPCEECWQNFFRGVEKC